MPTDVFPNKCTNIILHNTYGDDDIVIRHVNVKRGSYTAETIYKDKPKNK